MIYDSLITPDSHIGHLVKIVDEPNFTRKVKNILKNKKISHSASATDINKLALIHAKSSTHFLPVINRKMVARARERVRREQSTENNSQSLNAIDRPFDNENLTPAGDLFKISHDYATGTSSFSGTIVSETAINLDENAVMEILGLDPVEWQILSVSVSRATRWTREEQGEDAVTRVLNNYSGKAIKRKTVEDALILPPSKVEISVSYDRPFKVNTISSDWKTCVVFPDQQIGWRRETTRSNNTKEEYISIHDQKAMDVADDILKTVKPDMLVNLGDFVDLAELGRYVTEPSLKNTTQKSINTAYETLAKQREIMGDGKIILIKGNHDDRLSKFLVEKASPIAGLVPAYGNGHPFGLPYLLGLEELDIDFVDSYPGEHLDGSRWLPTNTLKFQHAPEKLNSGGSSAVNQVRSGPFSTVYGHCHKIEAAYYNSKTHGGKTQQIFAMSPGTLAKIDGTVPGFATSLNSKGNTTKAYNNWQQGVLVITYKDGVEYSEIPEMIQIKDGIAIYRDMMFGV